MILYDNNGSEISVNKINVKKARETIFPIVDYCFWVMWMLQYSFAEELR